ncbi:winged helix-turn-helix transcriptional regulator [Exilibacterium tricleocarpae]|uniref:Winged helix-turn-helix transcriptional regulator n=1 Tax=Exilibacterium tricleocarpae TaxID=2591008 RepID=A0A545U9K4_9GAMM|nr:metalloregulator ArsR/SmtB family transcription factor [Exilibacterium tricleocarpae]TQV86119.1 winged helix-turn-helix transcriptional regulator [Exilibacterium tricleocarpae]
MLDSTLSALSDPTRRAIIALLANEELSVGEVVDQFSLTQSAITRHLDVLERAQLVQRRREGQRRICSLQCEPLAELHEWLDNYKEFWQGSLSRLEKTLSKKRKEQGNKR